MVGCVRNRNHSDCLLTHILHFLLLLYLFKSITLIAAVRLVEGIIVVVVIKFLLR